MIRRKTKQRENILLAIKSLGHASFEQIQHFLKSKELDASLVTLYRNLAFLLEEGKIRMVEMSGKAIYEICEYQAHYHFHCVECGDIIDIDKDQIIIQYPHLDQIGDIGIEKVDVLLHGRCQRCGNKNN